MNHEAQRTCLGTTRPSQADQAMIGAQEGHSGQFLTDEPSMTGAYGFGNLVGLEYTIGTVTCFFSQQSGAVKRRSGTRA